MIGLSAVKNGVKSWQIRMYQALFLLQQKKMLYELGIDDEEAEQKFQGGNHIKPVRRLLFRFCQELEMKYQAQVVEYMAQISLMITWVAIKQTATQKLMEWNI